MKDMKDGWYKIKTWEEMQKKYGLTYLGDIECDEVADFITNMEKQMPENRIIKIKDSHWNGWLMCESMIDMEMLAIDEEARTFIPVVGNYNTQSFPTKSEYQTIMEKLNHLEGILNYICEHFNIKEREN
jgi:hypothetical protein